eukprot:scaffold104451_cov75-Attheya_sp.AAC.2
MMERTQNDITSWAKFLWVSGGLLELTKTKYFMIIWKFSSVGKPSLYKESELPPNTVQVFDQDGKAAMIERLPQNKGIRMLGVRKAGDLSENDEFDHLLEKTQKFTKSVIACP